MVSPSKIFKTTNNGFHFGIVSSKKDGLRTNGASKVRASSTSQLTHSQLLSNTRFYLDIRNRFQLDKVETILKSYGAKIEIFFRKDIKIIVTDKPEWMGNIHSPTSSVSPLTTPSPSTNHDQRFVVPKSRASAMLEKVSQQPASSCSSPLELAQKWRIPVLSVRSLWKWIAKVEEAYLTKLNEKKKDKVVESKIVVCARDKAPYIKIESIVSRNIPEFLELEAWPSLNLDGRLGQCPFRCPSPPSPTLLDDQPREVESKLFDVKDKVAVELIQYDTDFRIKDHIKLGECEEGDGEQLEVSESKDRNNFSLNRVGGSIKMTRRPTKNNTSTNEEDTSKISDSKHSLSSFCNGYASRTITRQSSQELLKVQCNGLTTSHRNSKLLSPSGSDVLPLPTSRRSTRRASASWCGSTRELAQLSPTDSEIENIRRSESSFEAHDSSLDSPGITLRPKGQLWLPIALIGTTAEENGNCIRKRYEYSIKQSENAKLSSDLLDTFDVKPADEGEVIQKESGESDSVISSNCSPNDCQVHKDADKKDLHCVVTRKTKTKNEDMNGDSRESSVESHKSDQERPKSRVECKKRSLSVCDRSLPSVKRTRTMSTNSVNSVVRRKKLSPEEKLLQDNKEYFKMEVLNTKLRSTGSLLSVNQNKEVEVNGESVKSPENVEIVIKKLNIGRRRKRRKRGRPICKKPVQSNLDAVKKPGGVKINGIIRRKRQSELMKLCNEAESFMFGESSKQVGHFAEGDRTDEVSRKKHGFFTTSRGNAFEECSGDSSCGSDGKRRRKRRSHAEAFIHDNIDYYKFETPGSRLRYQGSFADIKAEDKDFIYTLKQKKKEMNKKNDVVDKQNLHVEVKEEDPDDGHEKKRNPVKPSAAIEKILFSFESIPVTEPWYDVYKRQDEGLENYYPLLSNPNDQPFLLPYELPKPMYSKTPTVSEYYKRRRKKFMHLFNHPRKSPRCHASTLAILSSLKKRKRRSGTNISANQVPAESPPHNSSGAEDKLEGRSSEAEKSEVESEEILNFLYDHESGVEDNEILLEPCSDSETRDACNSGDSGKSVANDDDDAGDEDDDGDSDGKDGRTNNRNKKSVKSDAVTCEWDNPSDEHANFSWQKLNSDDHFKDMVIETRKKSDLIVNVATILETFRKCKSMDDPEGSSMSKVNGSRTPGSVDRSGRRRKKKARKINKTGWDNRKSRRRTGNRVGEMKDAECEEVKKEKVTRKGKTRGDGISPGNIIRSKGRIRRGEKVGSSGVDTDRPVLRSHLDASATVGTRERGGQCNRDGAYGLRVKKASKVNVRLKCSRGRYTCLQKRRLMLNKKKKRVRDYAWTTKKR